MKRYHNAVAIYRVGASNPSGIVHSLIEAMAEIREEHGEDFSTEMIKTDPAIRAMVYQLAFLCRMEPLAAGNRVDRELDEMAQIPLPL